MTAEKKPSSPLTGSEPVSCLKGVGSRYREHLAQLGVFSVGDLLGLTPKAYKDRGMLIEAARAVEGVPALVAGTLVKKPQRAYGKAVTMTFEDSSMRFSAVFFNQPYRTGMKTGESYCLYGTPRLSSGGLTLMNPQTESASGGAVYLREGVYAVWPLPFGSPISQKRMSGFMREAVDRAVLPEDCPLWLLDELDLPDMGSWLEMTHFPHTAGDVTTAARRTSAEALIAHCDRLERSGALTRGASKPVDTSNLGRFLEALPFRLTPAQARAVGDVSADFAKGVQMRRLVQGDVGSGKTAVAMCAVWMVSSSGGQAAVCAPTGILARQHYARYSPVLEGLGVKCRLIAGGQGARERAAAVESAAGGGARVFFGTHALFSAGVTFRDLRLVAVDEQQRFGVAQRASLQAKGDGCHLLSMSATPIPRTMMLTFYGDLDVSVIDSPPEGRKPVRTLAATPEMDGRLYAFAARIAAAGGRVFIVCPAVDDEDMENVREVHETACRALSPVRVGAVSAVMTPAARERAMEDFISGRTPVVVATSVIEVGVDVPEARLMWVKGAERFGLSQLHQLRGRVGRGPEQSWCVLQTADASNARVASLVSTSDGFRIALDDLAARGAGDAYGLRQSGREGFPFGACGPDPDMLRSCMAAARRLASSGTAADDAYLDRLRASGVQDGPVALN